jgi:dihydroorotate dehydrogenase
MEGIMGSIRTNCGFLKFKTPFLLAASPRTANYEKIYHAFFQGWSGAVINTLRPESLSSLDKRYWTIALNSIKRDFPDNPLIANIEGDHTPLSWVLLAEMMEDSGATALEVDFSRVMGLGTTMLSMTMRNLRKAVSLPLIAKLGYSDEDAGDVAQTLCDSGADMISIEERGEPFPVKGSFARGAVARISRKVQRHVMCACALDSWKDAAERIALGASCVQALDGSPDPEAFDAMLKGFSAFSDAKGFAFTDDFRGKALSDPAWLEEIRGFGERRGARRSLDFLRRALAASI